MSIRRKAATRRMNLTEKVVAALTTDKTDHIVWDDGLRRFGVRLRGGNKSWIIQYRIGTRQRRERIGGVREVSLNEARRIAHHRFKQVELGIYPIEDSSPRLPPLPLSIPDKWLTFAARCIEPTCFLYRHYNAVGDLLYVGMTLHVWSRQTAHLQRAEWANSIYQIVIEPFGSREELIEAEALAIKSEYPKHNKTHNDRTLRRALRKTGRTKVGRPVSDSAKALTTGQTQAAR
jgi:hypothetical protein